MKPPGPAQFVPRGIPAKPASPAIPKIPHHAAIHPWLTPWKVAKLTIFTTIAVIAFAILLLFILIALAVD